VLKELVDTDRLASTVYGKRCAEELSMLCVSGVSTGDEAAYRKSVSTSYSNDAVRLDCQR
jgi:hypothetical protein